MRNLEFRLSITDLYKRLLALTETKGEEYKGEEDNQFANFEREAFALYRTSPNKAVCPAGERLTDAQTPWRRVTVRATQK